MPLFQPTKAIARPAYYDRDAFTYAVPFTGTLAPHGVTQRITYSPPQGYAAFIENLLSSMIRVTAAAPAIYALSIWRFTPFFAGVPGPVLYVAQPSNTVYDFKSENIQNTGYMAYGDNLECVTADFSIGGTVLYNETAKFTEFLF